MAMNDAQAQELAARSYRLLELISQAQELTWAGHVLALRLLQSNLVLDDIERAAVDLFVRLQAARRAKDHHV
jgi:hypothetical protein